MEKDLLSPYSSYESKALSTAAIKIEKLLKYVLTDR